jgi:rhodanese-related sulfurtransferase
MFGGNAGGAQFENASASSAVQFHGDDDCIFVDVRSHGEIMGGTIKGAIAAPLQELSNHAQPDGSGTLPAVSEKKRIFLVCASGARSGSAARHLAQLGYENVVNLSGGLGAWVRAGGPVQR